MAQGDADFFAPLPDSRLNPATSTTTRLQVDGEVFEVRSDSPDATHYTWVSGPNAGYGFTVGPATESIDQHMANIRNFLLMIDPNTGYIGPD